MGRNGKNYRVIHFKCEYERYEEIEFFKNKFNEKYNKNITLTEILEIAMYEFFEKYKHEIE